MSIAMHTSNRPVSPARPASPAVTPSGPPFEDAPVNARHTHALPPPATSPFDDQSKQSHSPTTSSTHPTDDISMILLDEDGSFPYSLQRRHLPSHERLHTTKSHTSFKHQKHLAKKSWLEDARDSTNPERSKASHGVFGATCRHTGHADALPLQHPFTTRDEALWFLGLPEKARRQQFSKDEQQVLIRHCKQILSTSPGVSRNPLPVPDLSTGLSYQHSAASMAGRVEAPSYDGRVLANPDQGADTLASLYTERTRSTTPLSQPETAPTFLVTPAFTVHSSQNDESIQKSSWRHAALKPIPLPPPKLAPLASNPAVRNFSTPFRTERKISEQSDLQRHTSKDQSREDRSRQQLTIDCSSHSSDDAEFSFPLTSSETTPATSPQVSSFLDSHDEDEGSLETHGPLTPPPPPQAHNADTYKEVVLHPGSLERPYGTPPVTDHFEKTFVDLNILGGGSLTNSQAGLLRPGFRDGMSISLPELYGCYQSAGSIDTTDPLSLGSLPICDDQTGAHGAFAVNERAPKTGIKKVLKKMVSH